MAGKAYTMREMKTIVDHLVNIKAYSEIKGRKMWMDFADSKLTNRTWQSLKETFLKRILPDIHNPYFKLTIEQVNSFRAGYDVKANNRLQVEPVGSGSAALNNSSKDNTEKCNNSNIEQETSDENTQNSSADKVTTAKSLRDCISYSEPLTPMLQEVLDDFASEPESEGDLQIVESNENSENVEVTTNGECVPAPDTEVSLSDVSTHVHAKQSEEQTLHSNPESVEVLSPNKGNEKEIDLTEDQESTNFFTAENTEQPIEAMTQCSQNVATLSNEVNRSNSTTDASLPNNPEGLDKQLSQSILPKHNNNVNTKIPDQTISVFSSEEPSTAPNDKETQDTEMAKNKTEEKNVLTNGESEREGTTSNPCLHNVSLFDNQLNGLYDSSELSSDAARGKGTPEPVGSPGTQGAGRTDGPTGTKGAGRTDCPKGTNGAGRTDVPTGTKGPGRTDGPTGTKGAGRTDVPTGTKGPGRTDGPTGTKGAGRTDVPTGTKGAGRTDGPTGTKGPGTTDGPTGTKGPGTTDGPTGTKGAGRTDVPTGTKGPGTTDGPTGTEEVVVLRSHSDSDTEEVLQLPTAGRTDSILANVFGFAYGGVGSRRKKNNISNRSRKITKNNISNSDTSASSDSSSELYVRGPRAKNNNAAQYLRPRSAKILSLEEEGGLFVMYGNKIYPLVKDGNLLKSYVTYTDTKCNEICSRNKKKTEEAPQVVQPEQMKITLTKNDAKVQIEGGGAQVTSVLEQVMAMLHGAPGAPAAGAPGERQSTPTAMDVDVHDKIDKVEEEILKEIIKRDSEEAAHSNVTKRARARSPRASGASPAKLPRTLARDSCSPAKLPRTLARDSSSPAKLPRTRARDSCSPGELPAPPHIPNVGASNPTSLTTSPSPPPLTSIENAEESNARTRRSKVKLNKAEDTQDEVRYMFPTTHKKKQSNKKNKTKTHKSLNKTPAVPSFSQNTIHSTQGHEDSDVSPLLERRRKRKSLCAVMCKERRQSKRISRYVCYNAFNDSGHSSEGPPAKHSTLNTRKYTSEVFPLTTTISLSTLPLAPTTDTNQIHHQAEVDLLASDKSRVDHCNNITSVPPSSQLGSSMSLPLSLELSVIENLSISTDLLEPDKAQANDIQALAGCSNFMISDVNGSMPLMQQECDLYQCVDPAYSHDQKSLVTESLVKNIGKFDLDDKVPPTDRLDEKLRDLLLESAKKMCARNVDDNVAIDEGIAPVDERAASKKASKKICITPQKKKAQTNRKDLVCNVESALEDHVECSASTGTSCPPAGETVELVNDQMDTMDSLTLEKPKRKKKDVIKVNILRPKSKTSVDSTRSASVLSVSSESESGSDRDSVGLIHNHSETCLFSNECEHTSFTHDVGLLQCSSDVRALRRVSTAWSGEPADDEQPAGTQSQDTSLITEDLSDDEPVPRTLPTKWYLFSDHENTNMETKRRPSIVDNDKFCGLNVNQNVPVRFVTDLSTITEVAGDDDDHHVSKLCPDN